VATIGSRIKNAWNAFAGVEDQPFRPQPLEVGTGFALRPDRPRIRLSNERSIISSIYTRLAIDVSSVAIRHTRHDEDDRYSEDMKSGLNDCLTMEANIDQGPSAFRRDIVLTMFDKGVAAIVPVDTTLDPALTGGYDIRTMRVGEVLQWYPKHVKLSVYNEKRGARQEITLPKAFVAIVENPLYPVMNEPNSTLQRLIRKLNLLDSVDEQTSSGKLDLIIQLPYVIKSEGRREQAEQRRKDIEFQLKGSQYGVAYTDGTEKITQLNRPVENNLLKQIEYLTTELYVQLGLTPEVMNGTADEKTMLNYNSRTIEPILDAIIEAMRRAFLTRTARTQGQSVDYFRDPFKLVPIADIAELSDKLSRNEIVTANEIRQAIGMKPSKQPKADQLINSNMPVPDTGVPVDPNADPNAVPTDPNAAPADLSGATPTDPNAPDSTAMSDSFNNIDAEFDNAFAQFGLTPPKTNTTAPPGLQDPDPGLMADSLDEIDAAIDDAFGGFEE
jgi:hypothetical protein